MRTCPRCRLSFPPGTDVCPRDGERLVAEAIDPTESLVSSRDGFVPRTGTEPIEITSSTRADRPSARRSSPGQRTPSGRDRRPSTPEARIGQVLGQYRILEMLGRGGMGCVYLAEHLKLGRRVALKLLRPEHAERRDAVARFFQEARAVNKIRHRNIVDVTDLVELDDGTVFIIMELLDGMSLGKLMRAQHMDVPRALAILAQICDGLAAAHSVGIVHRDLKPDNVFVITTSDGADLVKLVDFGVAKLLHREEDAEIAFETAAGAVVGTPTFMSPEQAGGGEVDARSDIYSLGAIMYEMFTGEPIFRGKSFGEFVRKHLNESPVPPRQTPGGRQLDDRLEAVILRCLQKAPKYRYQEILQLKDDLLMLLGAIETQLPSQSSIASQVSYGTVPPTRPPWRGTPLPPPRGGQPPSPYPADTAMAMGDIPRTSTSQRGGHRALAVVGVGVVAASAAGLYFLVSGRGQEPLDPPASRPVAAAAGGPVVTPVDDQPAESAPATRIVVRFESTPIGGVYAAGAAEPVCTTPCDVTIDPLDGGNPSARAYYISRTGYRAASVRIDLTRPPPAVAVRLSELRSGGGRSGAEQRRPPEPDRPPRTATPATDEPAPVEVKPKENPPSGKKPPGPIDPAQTLDPFGKR